MILGRNLVEEERLYSTGDYELDSLLEKAFCDGYEYAQREFGLKEKREQRRQRRDQLMEYNVNPEDAYEIAYYDKQKPKNKEAWARRFNEDKAVRDEQIKKDRDVLKGTIAGGVSGAGLGAGIGALKRKNGSRGKGALVGAAIGTAAGAGLGALTGNSAKKYKIRQSELAEQHKGGSTDKFLERNRDRIAVSNNEMSPSEFAEKWNKYDRENAPVIYLQ